MEDNFFKTIYIIIISSGIAAIFAILSSKHFQISYYDFATIMFVVVIFATIGFVYLIYNDNKNNIEENDSIDLIETVSTLESEVKLLNQKIIEMKKENDK